MPDPQEKKRRRVEVSPTRQQAAIPYAELHSKTNFSFLEGASHPDELVSQAAELGYSALAITDRNSLAGVVRAHGAAKAAQLKLLIGGGANADRRCQSGGAGHRSEGVWSSIAVDYRRPDGTLPKANADYCSTILPPTRMGCSPASSAKQPQDDICRYRDLFNDRCYLFAELHRGPNDDRELEQRIQLAKQTRVPLVAANDVHFHHPSRRALADVLTSTRAGCTVAHAGELLFPNAARHLEIAGRNA